MFTIWTRRVLEACDIYYHFGSHPHIVKWWNSEPVLTRADKVQLSDMLTPYVSQQDLDIAQRRHRNVR